MTLSPRSRGRGTGRARETFDALERVGEGSRIWRKDFKLNELSESGAEGSTWSRADLVVSPKGDLGEDLDVPFDQEKIEVFLLDRSNGGGEGKDSFVTTGTSSGKECMEGLFAGSPYAANIADLDGGGRRRRNSSGSVLDANALVL